MKFINSLRNFKKNPAHILVFPFLSLFLMFFYLIYYCRGENVVIAHGKLLFEMITGYVIALLSLLFAGLFIYYKKLCSLQFVIWYIIFTAISFLIIQFLTYSQIYPIALMNRCVFWVIIFLSIISITLKIIYERFKIKNCRIVMLLVVQLLSLLTGNVLWVICASCISIGALTVSKFRHSTVKNRIWDICGSLAVYLIITTFCLPFNPMWLFSDIYSIGISFKPLRSTLIIKDNGKFLIYSGRSINKQPITDIEFDRVYDLSQYYKLNKFVGLRYKVDNKPAVSFYQNIRYNPIYPIVVSDSCAFVAADVSVFNELSELKKSKNKLYKSTSDLYFAYLNYFNKQNEVSHNALKNSCLLLQKELNNFITDSISNIKRAALSTEYLRSCSRHICLGLLNACGSDLLYNDDNLSAFKLFSLQFLLTFYDNQYIYQGIDFSNIANYNNNPIDIADLSNENDFEPWTGILSVACDIAGTYTSLNMAESFKLAFEKVRLTILTNKGTLSTKLIGDRNLCNKFEQDLNNLINLLNNNYVFNPALEQYVRHLQSCLLNLIKYNYQPDYNAYFLNRLNEIAPILCMHPATSEINNKLSKIYKERFTEKFKSLDSLKNTVESQLKMMNKYVHQIGLVNEKIHQIMQSLKGKDTN